MKKIIFAFLLTLLLSSFCFATELLVCEDAVQVAASTQHNCACGEEMSNGKWRIVGCGDAGSKEGCLEMCRGIARKGYTVHRYVFKENACSRKSSSLF